MRVDGCDDDDMYKWMCRYTKESVSECGFQFFFSKVGAFRALHLKKKSLVKILAHVCVHTHATHSVPFFSAFVVSRTGVVLLVVVLSCSRPRANDTCM